MYASDIVAEQAAGLPDEVHRLRAASRRLFARLDRREVLFVACWVAFARRHRLTASARVEPSIQQVDREPLALREEVDRLGSFLENGNSTSLENGSPIYLGVQDSTSANITRVVFSLTSAVSTPNDFAINRLSVTPPGATTVPEPASWMLLCSVLAVVGVARRGLIGTPD
jgi:hypothetical protein